MKMIKTRLLLVILSSLVFGFVNAQNKDSIPDYTKFSKELDKDNLEIDYWKFRISYIYSDKFKEKGTSDYDELKKDEYKHIRKRNIEKWLTHVKKC